MAFGAGGVTPVIAAGSGPTYHSSSTLLAQRLAPPRAPARYHGWRVVGWVAAGFAAASALYAPFDSAAGGFFGRLGGAVVYGVIALLIAAALRWHARRYDAAREQWSQAMARWQNCYFCMGCNTAFEVDGGGVQRPLAV